MPFDNSGYLAFANSLSSAGAAFGNALAERQKQQYLSDLVPLAQSGRYSELGAKLMEINPQAGLAFMEKQRQQDEFNKLYPQPPEMSVSPAQTGQPPAGQPMNLPGASLASAIIGQESGGNPNIGTSVNGAHGIGQILPATFARFAKPGEDINKPEDNLAVSQRITDTYMQRYGDPARAAVAYFSGEGNVAPPGSPTPWKEDRKDGNGKSVSSYVSDVLGRMGSGVAKPIQVAQAGEVTSDAGLLSSPELRQQYNRARWTILNPNMPESAKEAAKLDIQNIMTIAREDRSANRPTEAQRNYNLAHQQGYSGSFMDYQAATKAGTTVNLGPNEGEFAKKAAGKLSDRFAALVDEGDAAHNDLALVSQLRDLGGVINTGGGAAAQAWLANWGIKVGSNVGAVEAYQSIVDKLTPSQRVPGSGTTSDRDMATFKGSLPSLIKTPEGNAIVQNVLSSLAQSKIDRAQIAERVLTGEISAKDGVAELRKLPDPFAALKGGAPKGNATTPPTNPSGNAPGDAPASKLPAPPDAELSAVGEALAKAKTPQMRDAIFRRFQQRGTEMRFNTDALGL
jgi:hypothetical protein